MVAPQPSRSTPASVRTRAVGHRLRQDAPFSPSVLEIDAPRAIEHITRTLRAQCASLHKRGLVLGVSGGIDSSVCAALAAHAVGAHRVRALLMPGRNSSPSSLDKGTLVCARLGIRHEVRPIGPALEALGCYAARDAAIAGVFPRYVPGDRYKIVVAEGVASSDRVSYFNLVVELSACGGRVLSARLPLQAYLAILGATNMKQRTRKLLEYTVADGLNYGVVGTPNLAEYDQGFFVRGGDGLADVKPIAHLYKTQVFALARALGLPKEICEQTPTTDTYSLPQTQEEFYFALPYAQLDLALYANLHHVSPEEAGPVLGLSPDQVRRVFRDLESKRSVAKLLMQDALRVCEGDVLAWLDSRSRQRAPARAAG
jgi:NAD+ synthase